MSEIDEFLASQGMKTEDTSTVEPKQSEDTQGIDPKWYNLIRPSTVNIILGHKGRGKSGLGYFLLDKLSVKYTLTPHVLNLPEDKQDLLPENYTFGTLEDIEDHPDSIILIDEGTTKLPAGSGLENLIKGYSSMSRQRNQIIIFIFHASSDVGSRIFRGVDTVMIKEPSKRQIQFGSKDKFCESLLVESKDKFKTIADMGKDVREFTFVDSEEPEYHGLIQNALPEYWCEDLSCAWGRGKDKPKEDNTQTKPTQGEMPVPGLMSEDGHYPITERMRLRSVKLEEVDGSGIRYLDPLTNVTWLE